ncbi:hypothetical protein OG206_05675 [Streptomyces sp. NBC_01341]|uniref:hypothetical protein n=1 Tax=Streptomyces sp. NBC_01341 TaxID=2903831 RepID=UPI002E0EDE40|nr:hypothetical protein OG206_05675 [Streptomyces sp. NBC_01341]
MFVEIVFVGLPIDRDEVRKAISFELDERLRHTLLLREVAGLNVGEVVQIAQAPGVLSVRVVFAPRQQPVKVNGSRSLRL